MSLLALPRSTFRRTLSLHLARGYSTPSSSASSPSPSQPSSKSASPSTDASKNVISSCPAGTVLTGLNYLKDEPPILAKPDEEYPSWLWDLTKPKVLEDDGPGGKAEKRRLRQQHRQMLKDKNLFKAK